MVFLDSALGWH